MNYCLALLRIVSCYAVVSIHFGSTLPHAGLAVPIFMVMAFYFQRDECSCSHLRKRLFRIAVPFLVWSLLGFLARSFADKAIDWKMLGLQLLFGMPANSPLYFMNLLMLNTFIVFAIEKWFTKTRFWFYAAIVLACFGVEYSSLNGCIWIWLPKVGEITCGRFVELLPLAVVGRGLWVLNRGGICLILSGCGACLLGVAIDFIGFHKVGDYYGCGGLYVWLMASGVVAVLSGVGNKFKGRGLYWQDVIATVPGLTGGVYFVHKIVGEGVRRIAPFDGALLTCCVFVVSAVLVVILKRSEHTKRIVS